MGGRGRGRAGRREGGRRNCMKTDEGKKRIVYVCTITYKEWCILITMKNPHIRKGKKEENTCAKLA
jgi:hypothetical protein